MTDPERHTLARAIDADPQRAADEMLQLRALLAEALMVLDLLVMAASDITPEVMALAMSVQARLKQASPAHSRRG